MKTKFFLSILCALMIVPAFAQEKVVKEIERSVKRDGANLEEARTLIKATLTNPETENSAYAWYVAGLVEEKAVERGFVKQQMGQEVTEAEFYAPVLNMINFYQKAAELDQMPNEKGKVKPKYTKNIQKAIENYYGFLIDGGNAHMQAQEFAEANKYLSKFVEVKKMPLFEGTNVAAQDSTGMQVAFFSAYTASMMKDNQEAAIKELQAIKEVPYEQNLVYQLLASQYITSGDTLSFENTVEEGLKLFPNDQWLMANYVDRLLKKGESEKAVSTLEEAIKKEPTNVNLLAIAGNVYITNLNDYQKAEKLFLNALEMDPDNVDVNFGLTQVYFNQALVMMDEANNTMDNKKYEEIKAQAAELYKKALPYLEKVHKIQPDNEQITQALKNTYYNLGMEDKVAELDKAAQ
ncbi:tetratricopeptide repeat protein [Porphyromonas levii]|uniref:Tetratricopeptide repeat protein n=1 Tax=Porphyromonas levii TaxID=28114 RepID=A0A4Y8WSH4_9PORP|nr:tetratricopeptide repeat protein [Porphyromonas levii]MBR8703812.1 hypothetical protein [Porphyromonas levii]MBR8713668.1 hypothetical protein [Porphyromonas levii]MBR8714675.1 hypothetical protein [Porphyromonas levii]MBR8728229.1 hypothetical protein [Porphyromonas levii]MBR8730174.1 hypothetical protein [Porphyromonas levii]